MSVVTSEGFRKWVALNDSDDPMIFLLEIAHPNLSDSIRVSSDMTEFIQLEPYSQEPVYGTRSNGQIYYALPFKITLPDQPAGSDQIKATITIDNVDRTYVATLRKMESAATFMIKTVFASAPDNIQQVFPKMRLVSASYTATTIEAELGPDDYRVEPVPPLNFYPSGFPGLF